MNECDEFAGLDDEKTVRVETCGTKVRVIVKGRVYMSWEAGDEGSKRLAIAQLYENGLGTQDQLAEAFGVHVNSVRKYAASFAEWGFSGLSSEQRGPRGNWKVTPAIRGRILLAALRDQVLEVEEIQRKMKEEWRIEVSAPSIREVLEENGLIKERRDGVGCENVQEDLFQDEGSRGQLNLLLDCCSGEPVVSTVQEGGVEPGAKRSTERDQSRRNYSATQRMYLGQWEQGDYNAYAGGLLFSPLLRRCEYLQTMRSVYNVEDFEGYSLDEFSLTLFHFDLFGFRSMEDFKRVYADEFGVLLGRMQSPSIFTLRRYLHKIRAFEKSEELIDAFGRAYLKHGFAKWGVMYIDGHFMPYYGVCPINKGWHGVRQMPMKGSYNFLAVDEEFHPWLFLVRSSAEDLLQKIPELIEKAQRLRDEAGVGEKNKMLIVLFDREGYSAELFRQLNDKNGLGRNGRVVFVSWAKYVDRWIDDEPAGRFDRTVDVTYQIRKPETVRYFQTNRQMNKYGEIRAVVIESGREKKRAAIYTNGTEEEISCERIVQLMCRRWGEENSIKDLLINHMINYMPGYVTEALDEQPLVTNPKVKELKKKRAALVTALREAKVQFADEVRRKNLEQAGTEAVISQGLQPLENIVVKEKEILLLEHELDALPKRIRFDEAYDGRKLIALNFEKKRFLDCIKVFVCNMREEMCRLLLKHYDYPKEVQSALSMIVERAGHVRLERGVLRVRLRRFGNREIDYAARHLCEDLNAMNPVTQDRYQFPLHFEVA
jgi:transposase